MALAPPLLLACLALGQTAPPAATATPTPAQVRAAFLRQLDRPKVAPALRREPLKPGDQGAPYFERWSFASEQKPDGTVERVPMLFVKPRDPLPGRRPAVIVLHGTGGSKDAMKPWLDDLARRGIIGVAIDARYHGDRVGASKGSEGYVAAITRAWRTSDDRPMEHPFYYDTCWDLWRTVDVLTARDDVDPKRIGMIGISMGGIQTWLAAAADERVAVAVPAIAVQSFRWSLENEAWQGRAKTIQAAHEAAAADLGEPAVNAKVCRALWSKVIPGILDRFDGPSMVRLFAPRPLLILNGERDPNCPLPGARVAFAAAESAYRGAGALERLKVDVAAGVAHAVTEPQRLLALNWFSRWLESPDSPPADAAKPPGTFRVATFNASLNRDQAGKLLKDLATPDDPQARNVAEVIQRVRPDLLLVNEFDHDDAGKSAELFQTNYLGVPQANNPAIVYPYRYTSGVNTGVPSGQDLDGDGKVASRPGDRGYGNDALGFGLFPGQYGMVVYSMYPIDREHVRDFRNLLWKDVPGALLPRKADGSTWYSPEALGVFRLSSKSHWDVPVRVGGKVVHVLASHPTPPAFDGPEDRNGRRNHDEIRMWADYLTGGQKAAYLRAALPAGTSIDPPDTFVILGDQNADPVDGGSVPGAIDQLLRHPKVNAAFVPRSPGAAPAAKQQGGANADQKGDPSADTADFADGSVGNLRVDYVLPSRDLEVRGGGVYWPSPASPEWRLVRMDPPATSDHRLVWLDLVTP